MGVGGIPTHSSSFPIISDILLLSQNFHDSLLSQSKRVRIFIFIFLILSICFFSNENKSDKNAENVCEKVLLRNQKKLLCFIEWTLNADNPRFES